MKNFHLELAILVMTIVVPAQTAWGYPDGCQSMGMISRKQLWFYEAQLQPIKQNPSGTQGSFENNPELCFLIFGTGGGLSSNKQSQYPLDILTRTYGYMNALEKWSYWKPLGLHPQDWPGSTTIGERIMQLTGLRFNKRNELKNWYLENEPYLIWSEDKNLLIVEEEMKEKGISANDYKPFEIKAEVFWLEHARSLVSEWKTDKYIRGELYPNRYSGMQDFKAPLSVLNDFKTKEEVYQRLIIAQIGHLREFKSIEETKKWNPAKGPHYLYITWVLRKVTGQNFQSPQEWVAWHNKYKSSGFVFSEDKKYLVPKKNK